MKSRKTIERVKENNHKAVNKTYLFHICPINPAAGRCSLMLCRRATDSASSLRFCAVRPSNSGCDGRRKVGDPAPCDARRVACVAVVAAVAACCFTPAQLGAVAALLLPVELAAEAVESERPARNSVPEGRLSAMVWRLGLVGGRVLIAAWCRAVSESMEGLSIVIVEMGRGFWWDAERSERGYM